VIGSAQADVINASSTGVTIYAGTGNDTVNGGAGADILLGEAGNDTFTTGLGADQVDGGIGTDTVDYSASSAGVNIANDGSVGSGGWAAGDTLANIEAITGSAYADTLRGGATLGTALSGLAGNDSFVSYGGADTIDGGTGTDTLDYSGSGAAVQAYLNGTVSTGGDAAGDVVTNVEIITGSAYGDRLTGSSLNDTLYGGAGDDTLIGGAGADRLDGGAGFDTADYSTAGGVVVYMDGTAGTAGDSNGDVLVGIEAVIGSALGDKIYGSANADSVSGGSGDDTLVGSAGADTLDGGSGGADVVDYANSTAAIVLNLITPSSSTGNAAGDVLTGIEWYNLTAYDDTFVGSANADFVSGNNGNDSLSGGGGGDLLYGGNGNDTLIGGAGADSLDGGAGTDTADYSSAAVGISIALDNSFGATGGDAAGDVFNSVENVVGSGFADVILGNSGANSIDGGLGNDTLIGGAGADTLNGGSGTDTASYAYSASSVSVSLATNRGTLGDALNDVLISIENLIGGSNSDTLVGDINANYIDGGLNADSISGGDGNDTLYGNNGNDTVEGGVGADSMDGGLNVDTLSYANALAGVAASLLAGTGTAGDAAGDTFVNFENLTGSGYADTLTGDGGNNLVIGGIGNDVIDGGAGADTLQGGNDNDTLIGGAGGDSMDGGSGTDTADYSGSAAGVAVDLLAGTGNFGDASGDVLVSIENVVGSAGNDTLTGSTGANAIYGGAGNDYIYGGLGDDSLYGGAGDDTMVGGGGADVMDGGSGANTLDYGASAQGITIVLNGSTVGSGGDAVGDVVSNFTYIWGSSSADRITGSTNSEWYAGTGGADTIDGAGGNDTMSYVTNSTAGVSIGLDGVAGTGGLAAGDVLTNIANLEGTNYDDTLWGGTGANSLIGDGGNDVFLSGAGADTMDGGAGSDTVDYTGSSAGVNVNLALGTGLGGDAAGDVLIGIEAVRGSAFADTIIGSASGNTLNGNGGDDWFQGGAGADTVFGGSGSDTMDYSDSTAAVSAYLDGTVGVGGTAAGDILSSVEVLNGSAYNDLLVGYATNDGLYGGNGNDTLVGGLGSDTLSGGAGTDTVDYSAATGAVALTINGVGSATGTSGEAQGDVLSGIEAVIGSSYADQFTLSLGNGWSIDGGAGSDTVHLAANSGTVTQSSLTTVLSHVEDIDFTASGTAASLTISASFIQSLVGAGNASALTVNLDSNDTISVGAGAYYSQSGADYTFYSDAAHTTQIAKLTVG